MNRQLKDVISEKDGSISPFSPQLSKLCTALERLYVYNNLSGRLNFRVRWPYAAPFVFGKRLLNYDTNGTSNKKEREQEEIKADTQRIELLNALQAIKEESVDGGVVKMTYVAKVFERYNRNFLSYIYNEDIVEALVPSDPERSRKKWSPHLRGAELVEIPRAGIAYRELLDNLPEDLSGMLTLIFNERACFKLPSNTVM